MPIYLKKAHRNKEWKKRWHGLSKEDEFGAINIKNDEMGSEFDSEYFSSSDSDDEYSNPQIY